MTEPSNPLPPSSSPPPPAPTVRNAEFKAALLLILMVALISATAIYLMYARGAFEATQRLVLIANDAEGATVGMDLTFSGFPIGRVARIELDAQGKARLLIDVARKDAHWLRTTSVFTMERSLVGATRLRAYSVDLSTPLLEPGAERNVLIGDVSAEIPVLVANAKELIMNLSALSAEDSSLDHSLRNLRASTEKLAGKGGALSLITGSDEEAKKLLGTIDRTNKLLATLDGMVVRADDQLFGKSGVMPEARATIGQLNGLLADTRGSLKKVDGVLAEAQAVGANLKGATADLAPLRADVERNLNKIEQLVNEINRKWPFKREAEVELP